MTFDFPFGGSNVWVPYKKKKKKKEKELEQISIQQIILPQFFFLNLINGFPICHYERSACWLRKETIFQEQHTHH